MVLHFYCTVVVEGHPHARDAEMIDLASSSELSPATTICGIPPHVNSLQLKGNPHLVGAGKICNNSSEELSFPTNSICAIQPQMSSLHVAPQCSDAAVSGESLFRVRRWHNIC